MTKPLSDSRIDPLSDPYYYLENFAGVLDWVGQRYGDLLNEAERAFIAAFTALPKPARALLVRMVMRKGELFRATKLHYAEIGATEDAAAPLVALGWIDAAPMLTLEQVFGVLTKPELAHLFGLTAQQAGAKKSVQLALLSEKFPTALSLPAWRAHWPDDFTEALYALRMTAVCDRLRVMYFGNGYQDWTEFVLADLGIFTYEKVEFTLASRAFRTRADVDDYLRLHACRMRFHDGAPIDEVLAELPCIGADNRWLATRRDKFLFQIGQQLEQAAALPAALALYEQSAHPGARMRAIRVLERSEQFAQAYALATRAEALPESEAEQQQLLRSMPRLRRKLGLPKLIAEVPAQVAGTIEMQLALPAPTERFFVEGIVRDHFHDAQSPVHYVENTLLNSLFGLLCWDAVFAAVPGAFFHPFQHGPADLLAADFHARREPQFKACFAQLASDEYRTTILKNFADKVGLQSPFVFWGSLNAELLALALACIPAAHLQKFFMRILQDLASNRSGLPDLIRFWPAEQRYQMIEVKGPGDRLQDNQKRWLDYFALHAMPVMVVYVQWQEVAA
jgi:hypothetical protein